MPVEWTFADDVISLAGTSDTKSATAEEYGARQESTARAILDALRSQPGIVLADEVGMGKTYVALAVIASVLLADKSSGRPVVVMTPPGLARKWAREWDQFISLCGLKPDVLRRIRSESVRNPTEFFRLLDDPRSQRARLIFMTTACFSRGLQDPWIKLALIRLARARTKMDELAKRRLWKWASSLVRLKRHARLTKEVIERLLTADLPRWHSILVSEGLLDQADDDPVPEHLLRHAHQLNFSRLAEVLRGELPGHKGVVSGERESEARAAFNESCKEIYEQWLRCAHWRAPLLVLDEAHHAKNDQTRLANLFRSEDSRDLVDTYKPGGVKPLLWDKFDRMLFLTATPFQLGHHELVRVLRSFAGAKWSGQESPSFTRVAFLEATNALEKSLDDNRLAGRHLDRIWGQLQWSLINGDSEDIRRQAAVEQWWTRVRTTGGPSAFETQVLTAVEEVLRTKHTAEASPEQPWQSLRTWVIRHNRPRTLAQPTGGVVERRRPLYGAAIAGGNGGDHQAFRGLSIDDDAAIPFLLAARAQGELAAGSSKTRAFFAEGLCSSYEAFHHTREQRADVRDVDDDGFEQDKGKGEGLVQPSLIPLTWYESQVERFVPSKRDSDEARFRHPKLSAVVGETVRLWETGEKVLVFCFYRETARALHVHLRRKVEERTLQLVARKLGLPEGDVASAEGRVESVSRRLADRDSPFYEAVATLLRGPLSESCYKVLRPYRDRLAETLMAYVRTPAFIARFMPLEEPDVRAALAEGETRAAITRTGAEAMVKAIRDQPDATGVTVMRRVLEFYSFAKELAERAQVVFAANDDEEDLEATDPLGEYLDAIGRYVRTRADEEDDDPEIRGGAVRVLQPVRMVFGDTKPEVRERLMLAFNSPLFPEILVSSAVLAEGVDLHRFCRHVVHHDLCWNPSTLEQRTGRVDRIRCKAEWVGEPIAVYEPFLSGSADEKMFRVVRDRERWFQVVMGQKFEFDERRSEDFAGRVPLPESLAAELVFDLARHRSK